MLLERCLSLGEPAGNLQDGTWILPSERKYGVDQCVSFDERSVEVDTERDGGMELFGGGMAFDWQEDVLRGWGGRAFGLQGGAPGCTKFDWDKINARVLCLTKAYTAFKKLSHVEMRHSKVNCMISRNPLFAFLIEVQRSVSSEKW